eukprot:1369594-Karenia_brevis.AAC.1
MDEQYRGPFGPRSSIAGEENVMLNRRDWWDVPCYEWNNEELFAAETEGYLAFPQFLKKDITRFEKRELADDTGGSGPKGFRRGGNPSGNP